MLSQVLMSLSARHQRLGLVDSKDDPGDTASLTTLLSSSDTVAQHSPEISSTQGEIVEPFTYQYSYQGPITACMNLCCRYSRRQ